MDGAIWCSYSKPFNSWMELFLCTWSGGLISFVSTWTPPSNGPDPLPGKPWISLDNSLKGLLPTSTQAYSSFFPLTHFLHVTWFPPSRANRNTWWKLPLFSHYQWNTPSVAAIVWHPPVLTKGAALISPEAPCPCHALHHPLSLSQEHFLITGPSHVCLASCLYWILLSTCRHPQLSPIPKSETSWSHIFYWLPSWSSFPLTIWITHRCFCESIIHGLKTK